MKTPKVAISYAHGPRDQEVKSIADQLNRLGIDCELDQYNSVPVEGWPRWMTQMMTERTVLAFCDEDYERRFRLADDPGIGLGATFEAGLLVQRSFESQGKMKGIIPVFLEGVDTKFIPSFLRSVTRYELPRQFEDLYRFLTDQPTATKPEVGERVNLSNPDQTLLRFKNAPPRSALLLRPRREPAFMMLSDDRMSSEDFVHVALHAEAADLIPVMTADIARRIVTFVDLLPGMQDLRAEVRQTGILFIDDSVNFVETRYGHTRDRDIIARSRSRCWIHLDGSVELRFQDDRTDAMGQVIRALANALALVKKFAVLFQTSGSLNGKVSYKLDDVEYSGFQISRNWTEWLQGDLNESFDAIFLSILLEAQSAGSVAGDPDELRKLLIAYWRLNIAALMHETSATIAPTKSVGSREIHVVSYESKDPIEGATVVAVANNGVALSAITDKIGIAEMVTIPGVTYTLLVAHPDFLGAMRPAFVGNERVELVASLGSATRGSVIGTTSTTNIPGLQGRLNPILDATGRRYLYAENISIDNQPAQPARFAIDVPMILEDSRGMRFEIVFRFIHGRSFLIDYSLIEAEPSHARLKAEP